jgi:hypothetical protein
MQKWRRKSRGLTDLVESQDIKAIHTLGEVELDEKELRRYIDIVIKEVKKGEQSPDV